MATTLGVPPQSPWRSEEETLDEFFHFDWLQFDLARNDGMTQIDLNQLNSSPDFVVDAPDGSPERDITIEDPLGRQSQQLTATGSSLSPHTLILTPESTLLDSDRSLLDSDRSLFGDHEWSDEASSLSPTSAISPSNSLNPLGWGYGATAAGARSMNRPRPPPTTSGAAATSAARTTQSSSQSTFARASQPVSDRAGQQQWASFPISTGAWMDDQGQAPREARSAPGSFAFPGQPTAEPSGDDILAGLHAQYQNPLAIRNLSDGSIPAAYPNPSLAAFQQMQQLPQQYYQAQLQHLQQQLQILQHQRAMINFSPSQLDLLNQQQQTLQAQVLALTCPGYVFAPAPPAPGHPYNQTLAWPQGHLNPLMLPRSPANTHAQTHLNTIFPQTYPTPSASGAFEPSLFPTALQQHQQHQPAPSETSQVDQTHQDIKPRPSPPALVVPPLKRSPSIKQEPQSSSSHGPLREHIGKASSRRGGRRRGGHLQEEVRVKSNQMRKTGACWGCRLQRDECDHGEPCSRCMMKAQRGQAYYFECDRSTLPGFVHDFLPPSMTSMHQKQSIEDTVAGEVLEWDKANRVDILLCSGYGPPLSWRVYEFLPNGEELITQLQYVQDSTTGKIVRNVRYSPPYGLLKLSTSDEEHFEKYLDLLLSPEHLISFGWDFYVEESQVDKGDFQATLLHLMCELYMKLPDGLMKARLRLILRMLIVTFIMGHTLTIQPHTLNNVLGRVRHSKVPPEAHGKKHTSPRLANRQLKFFFHIIRNNMYDQILKQYQATLRLHARGVKEDTWLQSFCIMLGFAMVLEEVQRTLLIQADAQIQKRELGREAAETQAENACRRIDERFTLLIGLFQCKYRNKTWGENGSFGPGTPELRDPIADEFLSEVRTLLETRRDHLEYRAGVTYSMENQCLYTTRLTAKFLLPFLNLPRT